MTLLRPSLARSLALSVLSLSIQGGCSDAATEGSDGPRFMANGASGAAPVSNAPSATNPPPAAVPGPTPAATEQPPAPSSIDNGGVAAPGMVAATDPNPPAPPADELPAPMAGAPSAGCGLASGTPASPDDQRVGSIILTFPPTYDGNTPVPLVFAFHGANRTNLEQRTVDSRTAGSELEQNYVMAFMKSAGTAWDLGADYPRFQAARQQILSQLCIDTEHVFALGHSSGAQFIVQMLGNGQAPETGFAAIAPVSSSRFGSQWTPVPTLLIHGTNDLARPGDNDGAQDIAQYAESNQCAGGRTELAVPTCTSFTGDATVDPGCVQYDGCAAPTLFCNHDDPNYRDENGNATNHGWPCFANGEIFRFFESQR